MNRRSARRGQAALLALILLVGGMGLPVLDAIWFHSAPVHAASAPASPAFHVAGSGEAHLFGCAILTSASSGRALPATCPLAVEQGPRLPAVAAIPAMVYHTESALQFSRAPPAV